MEINLYSVTAVVMPQINWPTFDNICQTELDESVIKVLDGQGVKLDDLSALPCVLLDGQLSKIYESPFEQYPVLAHSSVSFLLVTDDDQVLEDMTLHCPKILVTFIGNSRRRMVYLMTGNLAEWHTAVIVGSNYDEGLRIVTNTIYTCLCKGGLQRLWSDHTRSNNKDGTFRFLKGL